METFIKHPSVFIDSADVVKIRNNAADAEQLGVLHPGQLAVVYQHNLFKLLVPKVYGGLQASLPDLVRLQEAISWADGSTGWVVTLCCGAGWFGGFINADIAAKVFSDPKVCLAGSGAVGGTAEMTEKGYLINGTWKYASGSHHATHITANCAIVKNGEPVLTDDGEPLVLPFIFDSRDVKLLPAWKYVGMVATGSDGFEVVNLQVSTNRQFKIDVSAVVIHEPLYRYPFLQLAEATLAVNISGIAIHFLDLCAGVFRDRMNHPRLTDQQKAHLKEMLILANKEMEALRVEFFTAVDLSWMSFVETHTNVGELLTSVSATSRRLAIRSREIVDKLYPLCGLVAAGTDTEINRAWRDLHTASQHSLLTFEL